MQRRRVPSVRPPCHRQPDIDEHTVVDERCGEPIALLAVFDATRRIRG